jgi:lipopolysaccharide export system protein LptA
MEMAVILKRDLTSRVANVTLRKGSMVIYSDKMRAIKTKASSRKSEVWIGAKEKDFTIVGWIKVK